MDKLPTVSPRNFLKETIALKVETEAAFLELAARLSKIHTEELWKGEYDDYQDFLVDARISKATASKLEMVYTTFVLKHRMSAKKLAAVGWSSLYAIAGHADTKEKAEELVEKAGLLKRSDLEESLKDDVKADRNHKHEWILYKFCGGSNGCGERHRVYEDKS